MTSYIELSLQQWRKHILFPFVTLELAKERLFQLEQERDQLKQISDQLIREWQSFFPRSSVPIYLTRVSDRSLSTLRWRRSKTHADKASQISFDKELLEYFHIEKQRYIVMKFESLRLDLNHQLAVILYECQRLKSYIHHARLLSELRKSINTPSHREDHGKE